MSEQCTISPRILIVEDDSDDRLLAQEAMTEINFPQECLTFVENGEELMSYLINCCRNSTNPQKCLPVLILLDLNMPKKDGREALKEIKANPQLRKIPVIIFTTSKRPEDIAESYESGANTYITKPATFESLVDMMATLTHYWKDYAILPA
jgi:CheY-like chemotaxis protein